MADASIQKQSKSMSNRQSAPRRPGQYQDGSAPDAGEDTSKAEKHMPY